MAIRAAERGAARLVRKGGPLPRMLALSQVVVRRHRVPREALRGRASPGWVVDLLDPAQPARPFRLAQPPAQGRAGAADLRPSDACRLPG